MVSLSYMPEREVRGTPKLSFLHYSTPTRRQTKPLSPYSPTFSYSVGKKKMSGFKPIIHGLNRAETTTYFLQSLMRYILLSSFKSLLWVKLILAGRM